MTNEPTEAELRELEERIARLERTAAKFYDNLTQLANAMLRLANIVGRDDGGR